VNLTARYRLRWHFWAMALIWTAMALLGMAMLWQPDSPYEPSTAALGGGVLLGGLWMAWHARTEGIDVLDDCIVVRRAVRRARAIGWQEIRTFSVGGGGVGFPLWKTASIELRDGTNVHVGELRSLDINRRMWVDGAVEELNARLAEPHPAGT
jgi:hypothetical protein